METFITSKKLIKEFIKLYPQQVSKLYIAENTAGEDVKEIIKLAKEKKVSFLAVPKEKILRIFNQGYSGILLVMSPVKYYTLDELYNKIKNKQRSVVVVLDEITDPQNFGAILRTSAAFNVDGVIIQQWNQVPVTQTVVEVSRGGVYHTTIVKVKNVYNAIKKFKEWGFWVYATVPPQSIISHNLITDIKTIVQNKHLCIIFGNENKGVRKNLLAESDGMITIKHSNEVQSLNVSVSCGIVLYEIYTQINNLEKS